MPTPKLNAQDVYERLQSFAGECPAAGDIWQFRSRVAAEQYRFPFQSVDRWLGEAPKKVLDWGSGSGHFTFYLSELGHDVTSFSVDHDEPVVKYLKETRKNVHYVQGSESEPTRLPFEDASFDAVFSVGVLEHVREFGGDELESMKEFHRILKSGGLVFAYHFPNKGSLIEAMQRKLKKGFSHEWLYTPKDVRELCAGAGFQLLQAKRYALMPRNSSGDWPANLGNSRIAKMVYNGLDSATSTLFPFWAQNHMFVARKR